MIPVASKPVELTAVQFKSPIKAISGSPSYISLDSKPNLTLGLDRAGCEIVITDKVTGITTYVPLGNVESYRR